MRRNKKETKRKYQVTKGRDNTSDRTTTQEKANNERDKRRNKLL
jgi:hypothetical protein